MATVIEEFVAFLGWEIENEKLERFQKDIDSAASLIKGFVGVVTAAGTALGAMITLTNEHTVKQNALAQSYGVSTDFLTALGGALNDLGLTTDDVGVAIKNMNMKFGESKAAGTPVKAVADAVKVLGLNWKILADMAPEDQMRAMYDAAVLLEDKQVALAVMGDLVGSRSSKMNAYIIEQGRSMSELLDRQFDLIMLTEEGRQGAIAWDDAWDELTITGQSMMAQLSGLAGQGLAPILRSMTDWIIANKELVKSEIAKWAERITSGLRSMYQGAKWVIEKVSQLIGYFGGLENALKIAGALFATFVTYKTMKGLENALEIAKDLVAQMTKAGAMKAINVAVDALEAGALVLLLEDLYQYFTGGDSVTGRMAAAWGVMFADMMDSAFNWFAEMTGIPVEQLMMDWATFFTSPGLFFENMFDRILAKIAELFGVDFAGWVNALVNYIGAPFYVLGKAADAVHQLILGLIFGDLDARFRGWTNGLIGYFTNMVTPIVTAFTSIKNFITATFDEMVSFVNRSIDKLPGPLKSVILTGGAFIKGTIDKVSNVTGGVVDFAKNTLGFTGQPNAEASFNPSFFTPAFSPSAPVGQTVSTSQSVSVTNNPQITINQLPGQSQADLAKAIGDEIETRGATAARNLSSGVVY